VKIGEFTSEDLGKLFRREQDLAKSFRVYCESHNKTLETTFCIAASGPVLFTLQINIINNGDNGEVNRD
jgi:hypothetical protein